MATLRPGHQTVVLVVDVQQDVVASVHRRDELISTINGVVDRARRADVPVVWVRHADDELVAGSPGWQFAAGLAVDSTEPIVEKHHNSSFEGTTLERWLADRGATHLVLAGAVTNWCIRATAYGALERGYDLTLVSDGHSTSGIDLGNGRKVAPQDIITDLNVAMQWLSYPGRTNQALPAAEVVF